MHVEFFQMLVLHLLKRLYGFSLLFYKYGELQILEFQILNQSFILRKKPHFIMMCYLFCILYI